MSRSIVFLEQLLRIATVQKTEEVEFLVQLLFELKREGDIDGN
ncbi:hypothetical protein [Bacillus sp. MRMR6]|nr:hypothetical protein [Bacillus sp. MRMR6]